MDFAFALQPNKPPAKDAESTSERSTYSLEGRVVILTGGAGLLGRHHCEALSRAGAHVVVADMLGDKAQEVASSLSGAKGMAVHVDVADRTSVEAMVRDVVDRFGGIDALVNNAGIDPKFDCANAGLHRSLFESYPLEAWTRSLEVNLTGPFLCTQAAAPFLLSSGRGVVVNIGSTYGLVGPDQRIYQQDGDQTGFKPVAYSVTKSAIVGFTRYLAAYWAGKGIRVNTLTLGGVQNDHDPEFVRRYSEKTTLGRMARPDEYGGALAFLLSDASSYMTGANLVVDGGWTAW